MTADRETTSFVAVITGGAGDLAGQTRHALEQNNFTVLAPTRSELDVTNPDSVRCYFSQLERIDLLVNNAGCVRDNLLVKTTEADWDIVIDTNLKGAFLCSQQATRLMARQRSGHIVNIGSFSGLGGNIGQANYAAAKAGLIGLTKSLAQEFGKRNIRINCVLPGYLKTKFTADVTPEAEAHALDAHCLGKFNTPQQAAQFIAALDHMTAVSGQVFQLDSRISP